MSLSGDFNAIVAPIVDEMPDVTDECPMGDDCPIHFRKDQVELDGDNSFFVTYHGEYAVTTRRSPDSVTPMVLMGVALGFIKIKTMMTAIVYLGSDENSIEQSNGVVTDEQAIRYIKFHDNAPDADICSAHFDIVDELRNGTLDVSEPVSEGDMHEAADKAITRLDDDEMDW